MPGKAVALAATSPCFRARALQAGRPSDPSAFASSSASVSSLPMTHVSYRFLVSGHLVLDRLHDFREPFRQRQLA